MWEEEKKKKGKTERLFSNGVIILVFLILAVQAAVFARYLIQEHRRSEATAPPPDTVSAERLPESRITAQESKHPVPEEPPARQPATSERQTEKESRPDSTPAAVQTPPPVRRRQSFDYDGWKWDRVELNSADSAALDALPGISPYYARQILNYRERLGSYADISQLLDIRGIDTVRLGKLADRIYIDPVSVRYIDLQDMPEDSMAAHPYIGPYAAKGIDRLRRTVKDGPITVQMLVDNHILAPAQASRLRLYIRPSH